MTLSTTKGVRREIEENATMILLPRSAQLKYALFYVEREIKVVSIRLEPDDDVFILALL